jgi:RNA polymerase sigma factor (sigma-70 family)
MVDAGDSERVHRQLVRTLRRSYRFAEAEAEDVAQDVIVRLLKAAAEGKLADVQNPGAYLMRIARNRAVDVLRRSRDTIELGELTETLGSRDDEIAAALEETADAARLRIAMTIAWEAHDELARRVVGIWLDTLDKDGKEPSNRDIAKLAGISHTTVNKAMRRFEDYLRAASS